MAKLEITALEVARRFVGLREIPGTQDNPQISAFHQVTDGTAQPDEIAWCSSYLNYVCHFLGLPRSRSKRARSWLKIGKEVPLDQAEPGFDVVVLARGAGPQPGPENTEAAGHVGFFAGRSGEDVLVLGGNQGNAVSIERFKAVRVLGVRRLLV